MKAERLIALWLPPFFVVCIIAFLTLQSAPKTISLTENVEQSVEQVLVSKGRSRESIKKSWWHEFSNFRKLAHTAEYFALGLTLMPAADATFKKRPFCSAAIICLCVSLADQLLKAALPTRHFDAVDLVFDAAGYAAALTLVSVFLKFRKHRGEKPC